MLRSMTGFGTGRATSEHGGLSVEVRCLNHRFKEFKVRLPKELLALEPRILAMLSERLERGSVEVIVRYVDRPPSVKEVRADPAFSDQVVEVMRALKARHGLAGEVTVEALTSVEGVFEISEQPLLGESLAETVEEALAGALKEVVAMREKEGEALGRDIRRRLDSILGALETVEEEAREMPSAYKERLESRLEALLKGSPLDAERLESEVAFLADRSDIAEEITRLRSHIEQLGSLLDSEESGIGRRMGFLVQEAGREVNTMGSKSHSLAVSRLVVDMKAELERIREQVQNVE